MRTYRDRVKNIATNPGISCRKLNKSPLACDYHGMRGSQPRTPPAMAGGLYDEWLVLLVQSGDSAACQRLARRWQPRLARTARRLLQDEDQALAATQEAWISILRGLGALRDPSRFAPWAFGILRRRCADIIRTARRARQLVAGGQGKADADAEVPVPAAQDEMLAINQAFAALPAEQRLAAQLYFVEGLTLAEIAEAQDVPLGTAQSRLFHARRKLKLALTGDVP